MDTDYILYTYQSENDPTLGFMVLELEGLPE
jgi:hypothetical protein